MLRKPPAVGLIANGSSGSWEVAIDETTSGATRWFAQFEGPTAVFYFEIASPDVVAEILRFIEASEAKGKDLVIGTDQRMPVTLVKDDEYADRFFLIAGPSVSPTVRYTLTGSDIADIASAIRQAQQDLDE